MAERDIRPSLWDPFRDLERIETWSPAREFASVGGPFGRLAQLFGEGVGRGGAITPAIDVSEDDERYVVTAEVPGVTRDSVVVEVHDEVLSIRGEKKSEREEKNEHRHWSERSYGSFVRSFRLPPNADGDRITAGFENGVLTLEIAKKEEAKPKVIAIK